jgi:hypothetical protein
MAGVVDTSEQLIAGVTTKFLMFPRIFDKKLTANSTPPPPLVRSVLTQNSLEIISDMLNIRLRYIKINGKPYQVRGYES